MMSFPQGFSNIPGRETLARTQVFKRSWPFVLDLCVAAIGLAVFYAIVRIAMFWAGPPSEQMVVSLSPRSLPLYAFYSVVRIFLAYVLSLVFAVAYGYTAAYNQRVETFMIAALDIMQSIPVLSFLPPVMLAMISLFPTRHIGVELGAIVLIFTGAVWNMAFSFYSSLRSIPRELAEATAVYRYSRFQKLFQLELPYAAIGLLWNSIMSVAGAWFFLMACEMFHFGSRDFRLPGLGSYLQTAADAGNGKAIAWGLFTMVAIIVATDQLIWRPLIQWSDKFKFEQVESSKRVNSPVLTLLTKSNAVAAIMQHTTRPMTEKIYVRLAERREIRMAKRAEHPDAGDSVSSRAVPWLLLAIAGVGVVFAAIHAVALLRPVTSGQYLELLKGAVATFLRVNLSLAAGGGLDDPGWRRDWLSSAAGPHCAASGADCGVGSGDRAVPGHPAGAGEAGRRPGDRVDCADAAGHAVVHPVQRDRRRDGDSERSQGSRDAVPFFQSGTLEEGHPAGHLPVSHYGNGDGFGRCVECEHHRRVLPPGQQDADDNRAGVADQFSDRAWGVSNFAAGDDPDLVDGGDDQPPGVASAVPARGNPIQAGLKSPAGVYPGPDLSYLL